jgi:hypothetical protein
MNFNFKDFIRSLVNNKKYLILSKIEIFIRIKNPEFFFFLLHFLVK